MEIRGASEESETGEDSGAADWAPHAEPSAVDRPGAPQQRGRDISVAAASFALHALLLVALIFLVMPEPRSPPLERSVSVEILDAGRFSDIFGPQGANLPTPELPAGLALPADPPTVISFPADPPLPPHAGETIIPTRFLSADSLADPRSAGARAALTMLGADERVVQLCSIEALAQIAALDDSYEPDLVAAYSRSEISVTRVSIDAPGAAFRSRGHWYRLAFKCRVTPEFDEVAGFEFRLGAEIPRVDWARYHLADGEDLDSH